MKNKTSRRMWHGTKLPGCVDAASPSQRRPLIRLPPREHSSFLINRRPIIREKIIMKRYQPPLRQAGIHRIELLDYILSMPRYVRSAEIQLSFFSKQRNLLSQDFRSSSVVPGMVIRAASDKDAI